MSMRKNPSYSRALRCACCFSVNPATGSTWLVQFISNIYDIEYSYVAMDMASMLRRYAKHRAEGGSIRAFEEDEEITT